MRIVRLVFNNADSRPYSSVVDVGIESVAAVCEWYASHHAGDRFTLTMDGRNVPLDINGEPDGNKIPQML